MAMVDGGVKCHMKFKLTAILLATTFSSVVTANDLMELVDSYPYFVEVMPNDLDSYATRNTPAYSTNDFKMANLRTVSVAKLLELRGLPDMRCVNPEMKSCIIIYGASDGAVVFHLVTDIMSFSHGTIYNKQGKVSREVIK